MADRNSKTRSSPRPGTAGLYFALADHPTPGPTAAAHSFSNTKTPIVVALFAFFLIMVMAVILVVRRIISGNRPGVPELTDPSRKCERRRIRFRVPCSPVWAVMLFEQPMPGQSRGRWARRF